MDAAQGGRDPYAFNRAVGLLLQFAGGNNADVGRRTADVDREQLPDFVVAREFACTGHAPARAGTVGFQRDRFRDTRGTPVVAEDQQRVAGAMQFQAMFRAIEKPLHRRVQESVEQGGPGAATEIVVVAHVGGERDREGAEQVRRVASQYDPFETPFGASGIGRVEADDNPVRTECAEFIDRAGQRGIERRVVERGIDQANPFTHDRIEQ